MGTLRRYWNRLHRQVWFIPSTLAIWAAIIALAMGFIDATVVPYIVNGYDLFLLPIDLGREILSTLTASLLTMTTITFSTIMVVLTTYTSQFSPRTLEDFITNTTTQRVLGVFIGGFVYSLLSLYLMKNLRTEYMLSASVGILIALICLAFFAYFIHHVATSIQVNRLIASLTDRILTTVDNLAKRYEAETIDNQVPEDHERWEKLPKRVVQSSRIGYIQRIDHKGLLHRATEEDVVVRIEKSVGDYLTTKTHVLSIWPIREDQEVDGLRNYLTIARERDMYEDVAFGLKKLVEIALRALSPGINDPNTAVLCIHNLGMILSRIASSEIEHTYFYDKEGELRLIHQDEPFSDLLYETFFQLRLYGRQDVSVMSAMLDAVVIIAEENRMGINQPLEDLTDYLASGFDRQTASDLDFDFLRGKLAKIDAYLHTDFANQLVEPKNNN